MKLVAMGDVFPDQLDKSHKALLSSFSGTPERVDVAEENKFVGFNAYQQVLDSGIDLIILATPPGFRPIHFEAAVKSGKNVFMEKPVASDPAGVRKVLAANQEAKKKKLAVGVGLQRHHQPHYIEAIQRLRDGAIGKVVSMRCYWNGGGVWEPRATREQTKSEMEYQMRNWYYYTWLCGDHICEQHIHNLDVCNWFKDDYPAVCYGMGGREVRTDKRYGQIFDHFSVEYVYPDGTQMHSQCRHIRNCWNQVAEAFDGSEGRADTSSGGASIEPIKGDKWSDRGSRRPRKGDREETVNPYQIEHDDLFHAIRNGLEYNEADYGAKSTLTAIMGRLATYSGKPVTWEEALNADLDLMPKNFAWDAEPPVLPDENGFYPVPIPGVYTF